MGIVDKIVLHTVAKVSDDYDIIIFCLQAQNYIYVHIVNREYDLQLL